MSHRDAILQELAASEGLSDYSLYHRLRALGIKASQSSVRTRRSELVDSGKVAHTGRYERTPSGRQAAIWGLA